MITIKRREPTRALKFGLSHPSRQRREVSLALVGVLLLTWTCQPALAARVQLLEGTKIRVELAEELSSRRAHKGQEVRYYVKEAVLGPNKEVLIREGARASGVVTEAKSASRLGKKGKLEFTIESVEAVDGTRVPLRARQEAAGKDQTGTMAAVTLLVSVLGVFIKGKNVTIKQGTLIDAYVDKTVEIEVGGATTTHNASPSSQPASQGRGLPCTLTLTNGDKVTGTFIECKDGSLTVNTDFGAVHVPVDRINTLTSKDDNSSARFRH